MAAMDCRNVNESHESWTSCSDSFGFKCSENDDDDDDSESRKNAKQGPSSDAMKLRKEDMGLFGFCPTWDEFYLVVCEVCGHVVKPQALKGHIELRHSSPPPQPRCDRTSVVPSPHGKNSNIGNRSSSFHMPLVTGKTLLGPKSSSTAGMPPGHSSAHPPLKAGHRGHSSPSSGQGNGKPKQEGPKFAHKNHTIHPVVRVERIPQSLMLKKVASHSPLNSLVTEKKELPSPQQPPPSSPLAGVTLTSGQVVRSSPTESAGGGSNGIGAGHPSQTGAGQTVLDSEKSQQPQPTNKKHGVTSSSKSKKASKERKLLPCKDREYDANKHCGVSIAESGKPCTRSLTCKTHSLSLRRAVVGRKKVFDELLSDHRAAKEAALKAQGKLLNVDSGADGHNSAASLASKSCLGSNRLNSNASTQRSSTGSNLKSSKSSKSTSAIPFSRSASSPGSIKETSELAQQQRHEETEEPTPRIPYPDPPYVNHHPKPAALCTFGMRQLGNGLFLLNRHWDLPRAAFRATLCSERGAHPPPLKKLCLESRLPPVSETVDPSDPYRFTCMDATSSTAGTNPTRSVGVVAKPTPSSPVNPVKPPPIVPAASSKSATPPTTAKCKQVSGGNKAAKPTFGHPTTRPAPQNNNAIKKRRTTNCVTTVPASSQTVTLTAVTSSGHTLPLSFPLTIGGEHLGALSRYQVSTPLVVNRGQNTSVTSATSGAKESGIIVAGVDVLNGQLPTLLHSVTVNRSPLLATPTGGLGITLSGTGLVGLSQIQQQSQNCNKNGAAYGGHPPSWSTSSSAKLKSRGGGRKVGRSSAVPNHATLGLLIEGPAGGGILTMANSASNSGASPSPSSSPLLRTDSMGSHVSSSPLPNGLSPPPSSLLAQKIIGIHPSTSVSPASRTSTPSPGTDLSSPGSAGSGTKGKNAGNRHSGNYPKGHGPFGNSINVSALPAGRSSQSVTYQQVFTSQMLTPEQLGQIHHLPSKQNRAPSLPHRPPLLATPQLGLTPQLLLNRGEDPRRTDDTLST